jgi:hypothetical protein
MSKVCNTASFDPMKLEKDEPLHELHEFDPVPEFPMASSAADVPVGARTSINSKPHCEVEPELRVTVT